MYDKKVSERTFARVARVVRKHFPDVVLEHVFFGDGIRIATVPPKKSKEESVSVSCPFIDDTRDFANGLAGRLIARIREAQDVR